MGPLGHVNRGQHVVLSGRWATHPSFGRQFKVDSVLVEDPRTLTGIERYLSSGAVKGLGPTFARRVVEHFGLETLDVIEHEPERLREVSGIGASVPRSSRTGARPRPPGRTPRCAAAASGSLANRIVEAYGGDAMAVLTREPYRLAGEIKGVGFRTADRIAQEAGIPRDDPARSEAAALFLLREAEGQGHCFLPQGELVERAQRLEVPADAAAAAQDRLQLHGRSSRHRANPESARPVYLPELERAEAFVAERLAELAQARPAPQRPPDVDRAARQLGMDLNADQRRAVQTAVTSGVTVVTGGPGTGKTTILQVLLRVAGAQMEQWLLAAPTGRAARRLSETTDRDARTLHRLLEYQPRTGDFQRGPLQPLEADGVLIDEASMVDIRLMASLLAAIPDGCRLVLVGDADQLPSVGPGRVLGELVASGPHRHPVRGLPAGRRVGDRPERLAGERRAAPHQRRARGPGWRRGPAPTSSPAPRPPGRAADRPRGRHSAPHPPRLTPD